MPRESGRAPEWPLDSALQFLSLLWEIEHALQSASKRMEARLGITGPQRLVLRIVEQFPGISPGDLARIIHLHPSTLTGILRRLVRKRLLVRHTDPRDKRRAKLRVHASSRTLTRKSTGTVEAAVTRAFERLPPRTLRQARQALSAIAQELGDTTASSR